MNAQHVIPVDRKEAAKCCSARGFPSFRAWAKANREGQIINRRARRLELVESLQTEYARYIRPNL